MKVVEVTDPTSIPPAAQMADYQAPPEAVLELVDSQLAAFGLEVVMYEAPGDNIIWRIERGGD